MMTLRQIVPLVLVPAALLLVSDRTSGQPPLLQSFLQRPGTALFHEFVTPGIIASPEVAYHLNQGLANGLSFVPPFHVDMGHIVAPHNARAMFRLAASPAVAGRSATEIDSLRREMQSIAYAHPERLFFWNLMAEWDQSGGRWVGGGRTRYDGLSRNEAHDTFLASYRSRHPDVVKYLEHNVASDPLILTSVTDYSPNVFYAYELGADLCLLERGIDELGDIATGIAFVRGAGSQYNRPWGIDLAPWRTGNNSATRYTADDQLLGGWSASYLRRHYYAAYMSGADMVQTQAVQYLHNDGRRNPLGQTLAEVSHFMLRRHPNPGVPYAPTALLVDHNAGFDPKHGPYNQLDHVWYQDIDFVDGDYMTDRVFKLAFPNHWQHGLAPGAPFADAKGIPDAKQFGDFLARGGDPRPYEVMPTTRWGETLDVLTNRATSATLDRYKVIILTGEIHLDARLRSDLSHWIANGGTLLMNASQVTVGDEVLTGASVQASSSSANAVTWLTNGARSAEANFRYRRLSVGSASPMVVADSGDPLVTMNRVGAGEVWLTTPEFMLSTGRQLLQSSITLLDYLATRTAPATVSGPAIAFHINQTPSGYVVTLINNAGTAWAGSVAIIGSSVSVEDWITDRAVAYSNVSNRTNVSTVVEPWGVRVLAFRQN
jgi:hypothetical protein